MWRIIRYRIGRFLYDWIRCAIRDCRSPFSLFAFISTGAATYYYIQKDGNAAVEQQIVSTIDAFQILIITLQVFVPISLLIAFFKTLSEHKKEGKWIGEKYVLTEPKVVFTHLFEAGDSGKNIRIEIHDAPPKSLVQFKCEYQGGLGYIVVKPHENQKVQGFENRQVTYGMRLNNKSETVIECVMPPNSSPVHVRLFMLYWQFT